MFPPHFNGLGFKQLLIMALKMASIKSGFILTIRSTRSNKQLAKAGTFGSYTTLSCQQLRLYEKPAKREETTAGGKKERARKSSTRRPISKHDCCVFILHLKMNALDYEGNPGRRTIKPGRSEYQCICFSFSKIISILPLTNSVSVSENIGGHTGHFKMDPSNLTVSISMMSEAEKKLAAECNQLSFTNSASTALLNVRDDLKIGISWNDEQVRHLSILANKKISQLGA